MQSAKYGTEFFREADILAYQAIMQGHITVDLNSGAIFRPDGQRAELLDRKTAYGRVVLSHAPHRVNILAHRAVWIAIHGLIDPDVLITHRNGKHWDNRPSNLTTKPGKVRTGRLEPYFGECAS